TRTSLDGGVTRAAIATVCQVFRSSKRRRLPSAADVPADNKGMKRKRVMITDYKKGVRFVNGVFRDVVGPGSYVVKEPKQQIKIVDMRPQPVLMERHFFQDALNHTSVISVAMELRVVDPYLATTKLRDDVKDALPMLRNAMRQALASVAADATVSG